MWTLIAKFIGGIGLKDYLYGGAIVVLSGGFLWYTVHERHEGAEKIAAEVKHTAMVAEAKDKQIEATAQAASTSIGEVYEKAVTVPAVGDIPGVVCNDSASGKVPGPAKSGPENYGPADSAEGHDFNPSGQILTRARDADDQIIALQAQVNALVAAMQAAASD